MAAAEPLLVEILVEELPPSLLADVAGQFARALAGRLGEGGFLEPDSADLRTHVTLRRMACLFGAVRDASPGSVRLVRGPAVDAALDGAGTPTKALEGFARSAGVPVDGLERVEHKGREHFAARREQRPQPLADVLAEMVQVSLRKIEAPRMMRWGDSAHRFIRPVRGVVLLHGIRAIPGTVMGVEAGDRTRGHRLLSQEPVCIAAAAGYEAAMESEGSVIPDFGRRKDAIRKGLHELEEGLGVRFLPPEDESGAPDGVLAANEELVEENAAMVEHPFVLAATIGERHLALPHELLAACIQGQQKSFLALAADSSPAKSFAVVSGVPGNAGIAHGNGRVAGARLADAEFFFARDLETPLEQLDAALEATVHHHALGSQRDRAKRIGAIAAALARQFGACEKTVAAAAQHALRDLATASVREFPELQGRIILRLLPAGVRDSSAGRALDKYLARVYTPAHRRLPDDGAMGTEACCLALAHYSELLVGLAAAGETPKGSRDPFGLRRCAMGIVRIAIGERLPFPLSGLLGEAADAHGEIARREGLLDACAELVRARARGYPGLFDIGGTHRGWLARAALEADDDVLRWMPEKAAALAAFAANPRAAALVAAAKRIGNIFRKSEAGADAGEPDPALLSAPQEKALHDAIVRATGNVARLRADGQFAGILECLAGLAGPLDDFFEGILVNDPDENLRRNRFRLLGMARGLMASVADFSSLDLARSGADE